MTSRRTAKALHQAARAVSAAMQLVQPARREKVVSRGPVPNMNKADIDFCQLMIRHHQIAIEMAIDILRKGQNPRVATIAHRINYEQPFEIKAMLQLLSEVSLDQVYDVTIPMPPHQKMVPEGKVKRMKM